MEEKILFKGIVGSQAYGTSTPESDIDYKGVYIQDMDAILGMSYNEQKNITKDETYFEIRRFLELCCSANPSVLELLFLPDECVVEQHPVWQLIKDERDIFLTKKCKYSFGGYAIDQIKKASGLKKKMNWEKVKTERKTIHDFCYVFRNNGSILYKDWLKLFSDEDMGLKENNIGLSKITHMPNCYAMYYGDDENFKGIGGEKSNDVTLSSIPKMYNTIQPYILYFNKDAYSIHCKEYREYCEWLQNRNTARYVDYNAHGQKYDGKNLLHTVRLLDTALEIATLKTINVRRPNSEFLLKIRKGKVKLKEIISSSELKIKELDEVYDNSDLPEKVDMKKVENLLIKIRKYIYNV